jgi:predicted transcriptional regulator
MSGKNRDVPRISAAEIEILQILWQQSPLSADQIVGRLQQRKDTHPRTAKTLLNRLLKKEALGFHEKNRKYHYYPLIDKTEFYREQSDTFLENFFEGRLTPLISLFSERSKLSNDDLVELKMLIEKIEADDGE